jgi:hypothetical protein
MDVLSSSMTRLWFSWGKIDFLSHCQVAKIGRAKAGGRMPAAVPFAGSRGLRKSVGLLMLRGRRSGMFGGLDLKPTYVRLERSTHG